MRKKGFKTYLCLEPWVRFFSFIFIILLTIIYRNSSIMPCRRQGQGEEVEDDEEKGVQDAFVSQAPGTFFFHLFFIVLLTIIY